MPILIPFDRPAAHYLADHQFKGHPVLPAVEVMDMLAGAVVEMAPEVEAHFIQAARFDRFLPLDKAAEMELWADLTMEKRGLAKIEFKSKRRGKSGISRTLTHAVMRFGDSEETFAALEKTGQVARDGFVPPSPERIYTELVPFGPGYQNISAITAVDANGIQADIVAPDLGGAFHLGNPFVLDAAFHAACVWGQRYAGVVGFPVGLGQRRILNPCQAGNRYQAWVHVRDNNPALLTFDIAIEYQGKTCEMVTSVMMRDVSGGRLKPPDWIREKGDSDAGA